MSDILTSVDHSAIKTNQAFIVALLVAGFIMDIPWLVALVMVVMLAGTALKRPGFSPVYTGIFRPLSWVRPDVLKDNPEPHRFAQGFGGVVLLLGLMAFLLGSAVVGWILTWLVASLAALNLFGGFCTGCTIYYWLHRLNVPGFVKAPPPGTIPGMRPKLR